MSIRSYRIIAVDYNGNEYNREELGRNQGQAAEQMLREHPHYREALNGERGTKNNPHRKIIRTQHGVEPDPMRTALGQAFSEAQSRQSMEAGRLILSSLQKKGLRLEVVADDQEAEKIVVSPRGIITPEERLEIDENQASIVALLKVQQEELALESSENPPPKETQRDIVRRMIPELPDSFTRTDLEGALRRWDYHELAGKSAKLDSLLAWLTSQDLIARAGRGHYTHVTARTENAEAASAPEEAAPPAESVPVPAVTHEATSDTSTLQDIAVARDAPNESTTPDVPPLDTSHVRSSLKDTLADLTSLLVSAQVDESKLDEIDRRGEEAFKAFEGWMDAINAVSKELRAGARARSQLRALLATENHSRI